MTRVLVVDDEMQVGKFLRRLLECKNMEVVTAVSGTEARQMLSSQQFQAALVDLALGDTGGLQLLQEIKSLQPECGVIIMTGGGGACTALKAVELGAYDYITKPFDNLEELENLVLGCSYHCWDRGVKYVPNSGKDQ